VSPTYAADTKVSVEQSRRELERTLTRYGVSAFSYGHDGERAVVMFAAHGRHVRLEMPVPPLAEFALTPTGLKRAGNAMEDARAKAQRQRWRALVLVVKAKLEAVDSGLISFEDEFLAHIVLPDGSTVGQWAHPQLEEVYTTGDMPAVLPGAPARALPAGAEKGSR
jgi:hypothetical protein